MHRIPDLIRLLDDPEDAEAFDRAIGQPELLYIDALFPHEDDQPFLLREAICNDLADLGPGDVMLCPSCYVGNVATPPRPCRWTELAQC